uniref:Uncharacterized protein n=1 Tax=Anguilla anguilla TaxID=7936 RepID=A0A0E9QU73_ANGAN
MTKHRTKVFTEQFTKRRLCTERFVHFKFKVQYNTFGA